MHLAASSSLEALVYCGGRCTCTGSSSFVGNKKRRRSEGAGKILDVLQRLLEPISKGFEILGSKVFFVLVCLVVALSAAAAHNNLG
jgi:hypothetical protein